MLVLAFDTATPAVTTAVVARAGDESDAACSTLATTTTVDARRHGELLAPSIERVLADAEVDRQDLDAIAVGVGPGPFTGLRVGVMTARMLGAVLGVPLYGVCSLDALALGALRTGTIGRASRFTVATDARRREVYWATYGVEDETTDARGAFARMTRPVRVDGPAVARPADVAAEDLVVGAGGALYPEAFPTVVGPDHPDAADVATWLLHGLPVLAPKPLYLRRPDATEPAKPKRVLA